MIALTTVTFHAQRAILGKAPSGDLRLQNNFSLAISKVVAIYRGHGEAPLLYTRLTSSELAEGRFAGGGSHLEFFDYTREPLWGLMVRRFDLPLAYAAVQKYVDEAEVIPAPK